MAMRMNIVVDKSVDVVKAVKVHILLSIKISTF